VIPLAEKSNFNVPKNNSFLANRDIGNCYMSAAALCEAEAKLQEDYGVSADLARDG